MTNQHPLTDKMCEDLMQRISKYPYTDDVIEDIRAAADWQLERVFEWLEENGYEYAYSHHDLGCQRDFIRMIAYLRKAMRPQQQQQEDN